MAASLGVLMALCLLSVAVAAPAAHSMCSVPKVYEANITVTSGQVKTSGADNSVVLLTDGTYHVDLQTQNKIAILERIYTDKSSTDVKVVEDFTAKIKYVIVDSQKKCTKSPLSQLETGKVTIKASQKLGLGNPLTVNVYEVNHTNTQTDSFTRMYMTQEECLPVFITAFSKVLISNTDQAEASLFSDLSLGIKDHSVFSIPAYCHQQTPFPFGSQLIQDVLSRHRSRRALWA